MNMAAPPMQIYPTGMRFHPTDVELIEYFLHGKADADQAGCYSNLIYECNDFYGEKEPWIIWDMYGGSKYEDGEPLYFYTKRIKQNSNGKRFVRKVGTGTWSGEYSKDVASYDGETKIGTMRNFRYEKGSDASQNGAWLMHEYESAFEVKNDYVICVLRRNPRKADQGDGVKTRKRTRARSLDEVVDHRTRKQKKKLEEEIYEVVEDLNKPLNVAKEEKKEETSYKEQGSSSCTRQPEVQQPYYPDQENNVTDWTTYEYGVSLDDLIGPISDDFLLYKSVRLEDQLDHGDDDTKFNYVDYLNINGGVSSQLPENNQVYPGADDDSKFNVMDYMNNGGVPELPNDDQAAVDYIGNI